MDQEKSNVPEISVTELKARMDAGSTPFLLDVREPYEVEIANLGVEAPLIPVRQLPARVDELEAHRDEEIVVYCRSGKRSEDAVRLLQQAGFSRPVNLKGGILAWSDEVDPNVPRY